MSGHTSVGGRADGPRRDMDFEIGFSRSGGPRRDPQRPFRILVMADLSGRASRGSVQTGPALAARSPVKIDIDSYDSVMAKLGVRVDIAHGDGPTLTVALDEFDHLHPDSLYDRLPIFAALRSLRKRLGSTDTFAAAAAEVRTWADAPKPAANPPARASEPAPADDFSSLLGGSGGSNAPARDPSTDATDQLIRSLIAGCIVPGTDPQQAELIATVDRAITIQMRAILHDPHYKAVEAAWLGVHQLITGLETGEELEVFVLDVSRDELAGDLAAGAQSSGLGKLVVEGTVGSPGVEPWAVLCGVFAFDASPADARTLGALGDIAAGAGAPFLAAATPALAGCDSFARSPDPDTWTRSLDADTLRAWEDLRASDGADWIGLATPRVLIRMPFGESGEAIERFNFEEIDPDRAADHDEHEHYPWAPASLAWTLMLGRSFATAGWQLRTSAGGTIGEQPVYLFESAGERRAIPCAEAWLSERAADRLASAGLTAVLSVKNQDAIQIRSPQSIAGSRLSARWV